MADMVDYSRLMQADQGGTIAFVQELQGESMPKFQARKETDLSLDRNKGK